MDDLDSLFQQLTSLIVPANDTVIPSNDDYSFQAPIKSTYYNSR